MESYLKKGLICLLPFKLSSAIGFEMRKHLDNPMSFGAIAFETSMSVSICRAFALEVIVWMRSLC
ncbi:MAG: hypothetical protein LDL41_24340 [Coleofasciculus sp. S288]|nr:hypothetical protein [Coleofasciculus sp. S288]